MSLIESNYKPDLINCPYCIKITRPEKRTSTVNISVFKSYSTIYVCSECGKPLDRDYVERKNQINLFIGLVGLEGSGKTSLINDLIRLFVLLSKKNEGIFEDFYLLPGDDETSSIIFRDETNSEPPKNNVQDVYHFNVHHYFDIALASVWLYDASGEIFRESRSIISNAGYVAVCQDIYFVFNIADSGPNWSNQLKSLLDTYLIASNQIGNNLQANQNIKVILIKSERLLYNDDQKDFSQVLPQINNISDISSINYDEISNEIKNNLIKNGCESFCALIDRQFKTVQYYCLTDNKSHELGSELADPLIFLFKYSFF
ncbi:MAG: hypothetical protein OEY59_04505 [Deltaproteobacteria bacterium]|nr:hypothetical protein [Deltaproteobacteria bacterium]